MSRFASCVREGSRGTREGKLNTLTRDAPHHVPFSELRAKADNVKFRLTLKLKFLQGDINHYRRKGVYDAVCLLKIIIDS